MPRKARPEFDWRATPIGRLIVRHGITMHMLARALGMAEPSTGAMLRSGSLTAQIADDLITVFNESGIPVTRAHLRGFHIQPHRRLYRLFDRRVVRGVNRGSAPSRERLIHTTILQCQITQEDNMQPLSPETVARFGLAFDPLTDEVRSSSDVFWTREHRRVVDAMVTAARRQSFLAVIGEVGSGKTICKMEFRENVPDNIRVVEPLYPDKSQISPNNLLDALILDMAGGDRVTIPSGRERKARRVREILEAAEKEGRAVALVLDEAHSYNRETIRSLKRLHEMERGFARLLAIILVGQLELLPKLNDPTLREVHQRCAQVIMHGLNGSTAEYLGHKFGLAGAKLDKVITPEAIAALERLCRHKVDGGRWFGPYPLAINVVVKAALNLAARTGEKIVTPEVIDRAWGTARIAGGK